MQGLNVNLDSTDIPQTTRDTQSSQDFNRPEGEVSFVSMLNREIELKENPISDNSRASKTDMDVSKSSSKDDYSKEEKVAFADRDVKKNQDNPANEKTESVEKPSSKKENLSDKEKVSEKKEDNEQFVSRIMYLKDKVDAEKINRMLRDSKENKVELAEHKLHLVSVKSDDENPEFIIEQAKNLKSLIKDDDEKDLSAVQILDLKEQKPILNYSENFSENLNAKNSAKEIKPKKDVKKLSDVISVTDLRTEKKETVVSAKKTDFVASIKQTSNDNAQVTMELNANAEKNILSLDAQTAGAQGSTFQAMLENQITENAADFVKAGNIVLKDNNVGNINLILHPESLGNVKISLELSDKVITGKILVSSQEAFNAFNSTQNSLKAAFIDSGFESASFDVSYANQGQQFTGNGNQDNSQNEKYAAKLYDNFVAENYSVVENNSDSLNDVRDYSINIVA